MAPKEFNISDLKPGMKLEVLNTVDHFIYNGILDKIENDAIFVSNASGDDAPYVICNTNVKLKGFLPGGENIILYGNVCGSHPDFWKIDKINTFSFEDVRNFYRQRTEEAHGIVMQIDIDEYDPDEDSDTAPKYPCDILNISGGGALMKCSTRYAKDSYVEISRLEVNNMSRPYTFTAKIVRVNEDYNSYLYGLEFVDVDKKEHERLIRDIFRMQKFERQQRNKL